MIRLFILVLSLSAYSLSMNAQRDDSEDDFSDDQVDINGLHVAIVPSAILNVCTGAQAKIEYGFANQFGINLNAGYLFGKRSDGLFTGFRLRPSVRYYFNSDYNFNDRFFIGLGYLFRSTTTNTKGSIIKAGGQFNQRVRYNRKSVVDGAFMMFGGRTLLSDRFWIEGAVGLGLGHLEVTNEGLPLGAELLEDGFRLFTFDNPGIRGFGIVIGHFSIGMRLF